MQKLKRARLVVLTALVLLAVSALPLREARAGDIQLDLGLGGEGSSWRSDGAGFGSMQLGYRFKDIIAPYFLARIGYGAVDQRMLTFLSIGLQAWARIGKVRPFARFGLVHQHEETMSSVANEPFGAVFGVGDGIRHRAGLDGGLGVDIPFHKAKAWEFHARVEALLTGFPDPRGPSIYAGASLGLGFNYTL
ncbi:MAG: hypothetical protein ABJE95_17790 [Byssovorax sp.]